VVNFDFLFILFVELISKGSFFSLCSYLTGVTEWSEIMLASKKGQSENVDILVGDIYGYDDTKYTQLGLNANVIASRCVNKLFIYLLFL
jgi:pantothenate kinase